MEKPLPPDRQELLDTKRKAKEVGTFSEKIQKMFPGKLSAEEYTRLQEQILPAQEELRIHLKEMQQHIDAIHTPIRDDLLDKAEKEYKREKSSLISFWAVGSALSVSSALVLDAVHTFAQREGGSELLQLYAEGARGSILVLGMIQVLAGYTLYANKIGYKGQQQAIWDEWSDNTGRKDQTA